MLGIFILIEILLAFIMGFANLIGLNSSLSAILIFIINIAIFFIYGFTSGKITMKKGFLEGIITGGMLILTLFILSIIFFHNALSLGTLFYYLVLFFITIVASTIGKNKKIDSMPEKS